MVQRKLVDMLTETSATHLYPIGADEGRGHDASRARLLCQAQ
jgi:hypothetical protein